VLLLLKRPWIVVGRDREDRTHAQPMKITLKAVYYIRNGLTGQHLTHPQAKAPKAHSIKRV